MSVLGYEDIGGLDVSMNNPLAVRGLQSFGNFDSHRQHALHVHRTAGDAARQRHPVEKLHGNECLLAMLADFVDRTDVGMIQCRRGARLPAKPFEGLRITRESIRQEFEGHEAAEVGVFRFVDHAHAAATELLDNAVMRNGLATGTARFVRDLSLSGCVGV